MNILYFEDETMVSEMTTSFLKKQGHSVLHFNSFDIFESYPFNCSDIDLVLLDIEMPQMNGYQICKELRKKYIGEFTPVIFTSGLMEEDSILAAFEAGGNDYLMKPLKLGEMKAKLAKVSERLYNEHLQVKQVHEAHEVAIKAMSTSGDLGGILHFHDSCASISDSKSITHKLIKLLESFNLKSSVYVNSESPLYVSYSGLENPLEVKTIKMLRETKRIHTWESRAIYNFEHISVLILNMPVEDNDRYGEINDLVCLILNGVNARLSAISISKEAEKKSALLETLFETLSRQTLDLTNTQMVLGEQFEQILANLELTTLEQITRFNLIEYEEQALMSSIKNSLFDAMNIFEKSENLNNDYNQFVSNLKQKYYQ